MFEIIGAAITLTAMIILYKAYRSLFIQRDLLIHMVSDRDKNIEKLRKIVAAHGCAPKELVTEGTEHTCEDCGSVWKANEFKVTWAENSYKNRTTQSWQLT